MFITSNTISMYTVVLVIWWSITSYKFSYWHSAMIWLFNMLFRSIQVQIQDSRLTGISRCTTQANLDNSVVFMHFVTNKQTRYSNDVTVLDWKICCLDVNMMSGTTAEHWTEALHYVNMLRCYSVTIRGMHTTLLQPAPSWYGMK